MEPLEVLRLGPAKVDLVNRRVVHPDRTAALSPLETSLLTYMVGRRGANATREELLVQVWGYSPRVVTRAVDHTISRLRKKLEADPGEPRWLVSTRGGGYRLELAPDDVPVSLPAERDRFVGRGAELGELAARFEDGARLVTVLG
ncbi:MAG: winged helix-turn-helix domain-containing protein, partial [Myxococcota bacterium]